jgi:hypothetical protein
MWVAGGRTSARKSTHPIQVAASAIHASQTKTEPQKYEPGTLVAQAVAPRSTAAVIPVQTPNGRLLSLAASSSPSSSARRRGTERAAMNIAMMNRSRPIGTVSVATSPTAVATAIVRNSAASSAMSTLCVGLGLVAVT